MAILSLMVGYWPGFCVWEGLFWKGKKSSCWGHNWQIPTSHTSKIWPFNWTELIGWALTVTQMSWRVSRPSWMLHIAHYQLTTEPIHSRRLRCRNFGHQLFTPFSIRTQRLVLRHRFRGEYQCLQCRRRWKGCWDPWGSPCFTSTRSTVWEWLVSDERA